LRIRPQVEALLRCAVTGPRIREDGWERPVPLGRQVELPPFPANALPPWLAQFVKELHVAMQTPVDLPGVLALVALATAAGGRAVVEVRPGWREPLNLFAAVAMAPGSRKSGVFARITEPLNQAEREAIAQARPLVVEAATRRRAADSAADQAAAMAGKTDPADRDDAVARAVGAAEMAEAITVPVMPRLLADDATPEALASLLVEQKGRIAVLSPEGDIFEMMAGRYSKTGPSLGVYLKGHAGDAMRVDRKGRSPEHVATPALTVGLAVQPDVIRSLADRPGFRGRGLLARFLYSVPANNVGRRTSGAPPVSVATADRYDRQLVALVHSLAEWEDPAVIPFTPAADEALLAFEQRIEPALGPGGALAHIADWGAKLAGAVARLAGLLHLGINVSTGWGLPLAPETVHAAIRLGEYFADHALAVFDLMAADPLIADARAVAAWAVDREDFTRREVHRAFESRFPKATEVDPVLELLEDHGWIRRQEDDRPGTKGGRPPSPSFLVNPLTAPTEPIQPTQPQPVRGSVGSIGSVVQKPNRGDAP
jgi:replicative DNA helicase